MSGVLIFLLEFLGTVPLSVCVAHLRAVTRLICLKYHSTPTCVPYPCILWVLICSNVGFAILGIRYAPQIKNRNCRKIISRKKKTWSRIADGGHKPGQTGRMTIDPNIALTLTGLRIADCRLQVKGLTDSWRLLLDFIAV